MRLEGSGIILYYKLGGKAAGPGFSRVWAGCRQPAGAAARRGAKLCENIYGENRQTNFRFERVLWARESFPRDSTSQMKPDAVSGLDNAAWPWFVLDEAGLIEGPNLSAMQALGLGRNGGGTEISAIWPAGGGMSPAELFARWAQSPAALVPLNLIGPGGASLCYQACVCPLPGGGRKRFLLQLLPSAAPTEARAVAADPGLVQAHKQKLDCALQLARTASHGFNNALTGILGHTSLMLSKMEPDNPWRGSLLEVEKSAAKAAEIANDLSTFSRAEKESKIQLPGNLNVLVQRNVELFQSAKQDKDITWSLQLERKLYSARFDEAKMQQALVKIIENAIEALNPRGRITLQTKNLELTQATQDRDARLAAGTYVCAEITDDGCGIEPEILPRIFEPFFTTKRHSNHRGLGLAWVYGIVTNQGGGVAVSSQAGLGTSVRVYLPGDKRFVKDTGAGGTELTGSESILLVDDEDLMLTMGQTVLSAYGYRVLTANSGQRALEILAQIDHPIDLLITDMVMPAMSGRELVEHVRRLSPETRVLCSSGYVRPNLTDQSQIPYLQKPFASQELLVKVRRALTPGEAGPVD